MTFINKFQSFCTSVFKQQISTTSLETSQAVGNFLSNFRRLILGDPGADSGDEGKSKRAEKCGAKKSKERREEPLGTIERLRFTFAEYGERQT